MQKIKFIKDYKGFVAGEIVEVSNNEAFSLIDSGIAVSASNSDFLVKAPFGKTKAFDTGAMNRKHNIKKN